MKTRQHHFINSAWKDCTSDLDPGLCQLVLVFGSPEHIVEPGVYVHLNSTYPNADIVFSSTAGEIINDAVYDNSIVATAIQLEKNTVACVKTNIDQHTNSFETGNFLMKALFRDDLSNIFIIADGTSVNGSELVDGINHDNQLQVTVTGGLAGDAARFEKTFTGLNEFPSQGNVIAIGFYGKNMRVGHGSLGGWDEFGHERTITRSEKNVLYEIDYKNALDLYKQYLGDYADELPGSALLFPLSIRINGSDKNLVRTILSISEEEKSMTFAGNLPEGSKVRLMKANFDKLVQASSAAAKNSAVIGEGRQPELAILVSCVGRKLVLNEMIDEEVQAAKDILGNNTAITGFYSYGEISPFNNGTQCELHNQTMTITTLTEI
jgi:hypothetical protein